MAVYHVFNFAVVVTNKEMKRNHYLSKQFLQIQCQLNEYFNWHDSRMCVYEHPEQRFRNDGTDMRYCRKRYHKTHAFDVEKTIIGIEYPDM